MIRSTLRLGGPIALATLALSAPTFAQGADDCAAPTVIAGLGDFTYDLTGMTDSGFDGGDAILCNMGSGGMPAYYDVFFTWTAPKVGTYRLHTCTESQDTVMNVHLGNDCSALCVDGDESGDCGAGNTTLTAEVFIGYADEGDDYLVQVGQWSSGTQSIFTGTLTIEEIAPDNDTCATPRVISGYGIWNFDNTNADTSAFNAGDTFCDSASGASSPRSDVFFAWTATDAGDHHFTTCPSGLDTALSLYTGTDCAATCFDIDDGGSCSGVNDYGETILGVAVGDQYLIQTGAWSTIGNTGVHSLTIMDAGFPANTWCSTGTVISGVGSWTYDNSAAHTSRFNSGDPLCLPSAGSLDGFVGQDVFYVWTALSSGDHELTSCSSGFDTDLAVYTGSDCSATCLLTGDQDGTCTTGSDYRETIVGVLPGDTYLIQTGTWCATCASGSTTLTISVGSLANETCSSPQIISGLGSWPYDNTIANDSGFDGGGTFGCVAATNMFKDVFFAWTADVTADHVLTTCPSGFDTTLNIHLGSDCAATCVTGDDGGNCTGVSDYEQIFFATAGETYLIQTGAWSAGAATGPTDLTISLTPPPNNDCSTPTVIIGEGTTVVDNTSATDSGFDGGGVAASGGSSCVTSIVRDVFYVWTVPCDGDFVIDTEGTGATDTRINVHLGSDCTATCYEGDDDGGTGLLSSLVVTGALAGDSLLIQVGNFAASNANVPINLNINRVGSACNIGIVVTCDPANDHYLGNNAKLDTSYLGSGVLSGLHIEAIDGPASEFGFVIVAANATGSASVFEGVLCLNLPIGRYDPNNATNQGNPALNSLGQFDAAGVFQSITGNSTVGSGFDVPFGLPGGLGQPSIVPGDIWNFQVWFRDLDAIGNSSANFSNVIEVTFP